MKYSIEGGNLPAVICTLEPNESMTCEGGAMGWMSPNISMSTEGGGSFGKAIGRLFSGENIFRNVFTANEEGGYISFLSSYPGSIVPVEIDDDHPIIIQKGAFLAATMGIKTEVFFNKKVSVGVFGGEGFIMEKIYGNGTVFIEIDGSAIEKDLAAGEKIIVDTGSLARMDATCNLDILSVKGAKNVFFGGEGLFFTEVTGPGKVTLQTMAMSDFVNRIKPYLPSSGSSASVSTSSSSGGSNNA